MNDKDFQARLENLPEDVDQLTELLCEAISRRDWVAYEKFDAAHRKLSGRRAWNLVYERTHKTDFKALLASKLAEHSTPRLQKRFATITHNNKKLWREVTALEKRFESKRAFLMRQELTLSAILEELNARRGEY